jgi:hypothetical protein
MTMDSTGARSLSGGEDPHSLAPPFGRCRRARVDYTLASVLFEPKKK